MGDQTICAKAEEELRGILEKAKQGEKVGMDSESRGEVLLKHPQEAGNRGLQLSDPSRPPSS